MVYTGGVKLRRSSGGVSPIVGFNASLGDEPSALEGVSSTRGYFYFNTGFDWKWDMGMFLHVGLNWTLTKQAGATEMKPYLQIGLHY